MAGFDQETLDRAAREREVDLTTEGQDQRGQRDGGT